MCNNETVAGANTIDGSAGSKSSGGVLDPATTHRYHTRIAVDISSRLPRHTPGRHRRFLAIILGLWALTVHAEEYEYHYVPLYDIPLPAGFDTFWPRAIDDKGRVYGTLFGEETGYVLYVSVYENGVVTTMQPGDLILSQGIGEQKAPVNRRGTVGGAVWDTNGASTQAALFNKNRVELIPKLPGALNERVVSLNDSNTALVWTEYPSGGKRNTYRLYKNGKTSFQYQLPTGSDCPACWAVNNQGMVSGSILDDNLQAGRAIRFQPPYYEPQVLDPLPGDIDSGAYEINNRGNILGKSIYDPYTNTGISIGIWDRRGEFQPYSVENTYYDARFNDKNLIVVTNNQEDYQSYLVPEPGLRLNLQDLVDNPDSIEFGLMNVVDINNRGDMIGYGLLDESAVQLTGFLLERIESGGHGGHHGHGGH